MIIEENICENCGNVYTTSANLKKHKRVCRVGPVVIDLQEENDQLKVGDDNLSDKLLKLNELFQSGALTKEEFEKAKKKILDN